MFNLLNYIYIIIIYLIIEKILFNNHKYRLINKLKNIIKNICIVYLMYLIYEFYNNLGGILLS